MSTQIAIPKRLPYEFDKQPLTNSKGEPILGADGKQVVGYPDISDWPVVPPINRYDKLVAARILLLDKQVYIAHGVYSLRNPVITTQIPTAAVAAEKEGGEIHFFFNPNFLDRLTVDELAFIMAHEAIHVASGHLVKREYPILWNICTDVCVNTWLLDKSDLQLRNPIKESMWDAAKVEMNPNDIINYVEADDLYEMLLPRMKAMEKKLMKIIAEYQKNAMSGDLQEKMQGDGIDGPDSNSLKEGEGESSAGSTMDEHKDWDAVGQQAMDNVLRDLENNGDLKRARTAGKMPVGVERRFADINQDFNWEKHIERFMASIPKRVDTWERPNRRLAAGGFDPSDPLAPPMVPGSKMFYEYTVLVYADMSGSIGDDEVSRFRSVLLKKPHEVGIKAFSFDTEIYEWPNWETDMPKGGGGTSFRRVVEHAQQQKGRVDGIIVLTDGYDTEPSPNKPGKWLWISTAQLHTKLSGAWVKMPEVAKRTGRNRIRY